MTAAAERAEAIVGSADILRARILVVDDQPDNVLLLEGVLRAAGYTCVESTGNPAEVCELHRRRHFILILLDLQMPVMNGFQVMEGLREIEGDGYLPVLAITAQPAHKLRALAAGARDFVSKPFDIAELGARVRNLVEVRLLQLAELEHIKALEGAVQELEVSREVLRLKTLDERRRDELELNLAKQTQESLLPRSMPAFDNYLIRAFNCPTRYVGGDFYDFPLTASGECAGVLADVSGKGIAAALLSSMVLGALSMECQAGTRPGEALNRINRLICGKSLAYQFVTLFLVFLQRDGSGEFVSAGHNPAYLYRAETKSIEELVSSHYFLGAFDFATYESRPIVLGRGDVLLIYSDGLTDAESESDEMFGAERLKRIMLEQAPAGSLQFEAALLDAIEQFTRGAPQTDDITFVIVERSS